jgi:hypothetical protein
MRSRTTHHGQADGSAESVQETETRRVLRAAPDGSVEEWTAFIHRQLEQVFSNGLLAVRQRLHIRFVVRRYSRDVLQRDDAYVPGRTPLHHVPALTDQWTDFARRRALPA